MEKTPRYTQRERNMVLGYAAQYKDVIENKRTDAESNRKKDEVWLQIAKEFNSKVYHQRSAKQLRQLYKNMKLLLKKDLCGEDKGNRSFMDLLNTLSQQDSVTQYISDQTDGAGIQSGGNGCHLADDYEDAKLPMYEGMDTDVILIKSETISDNGMDCMDDDDDDDCPSTKVPEVCLEEDDDELFAADLRQLNQGGFPRLNGSHLANSSGNNNNNNSSSINNNNNNSNDPLTRAPSSPVCSTKTSVSSTGSYISASVPKTEITLSSVGNIRVGAFASINKTLQNGSNSNSSTGSTNNNNSNSINNISIKNGLNCSSSNNNNNDSSSSNKLNANGLELTAEQVQQHLLLNGLGLSAVQHPPAHALQSAIAASTSGSGSSTRLTTQTLQLPRLARGHTAGGVVRGGAEATQTVAAAAAAAAAAAVAAAGTNGNSNAGVQLLLNGHQSRDKTHAQQQGSGLSVAAGSFNGYNGLGVSSISAINCASANSSGSAGLINSSSSSHNHNNNNNSSSSNNNALNNSGSSSSSRGQHNEYMMSLAVEERKRKIELLNAQIQYWQTLTKKLDSQSGHFPNPACLCHFPGSDAMGASVGVGASSTAAASALQTQSSSS